MKGKGGKGDLASHASHVSLAIINFHYFFLYLIRCQFNTFSFYLLPFTFIPYLSLLDAVPALRGDPPALQL